ncbi:unnamed protein product [Microthlaspi erraticum]|uniref:Arabidopsis retrotransposon Orf1 C-terminal domain-containing protein n=1 Tax=Microthlaspi erraticum TaxID=1685480 RepID=A0A6D2JNJ2_9BRAS|nr:unnamed protein product [Microthlaspi erraticum]
MDIKFCKTNLLIDQMVVNEKYQFKFTHPTAGPSKMLLPNPSFTTVVERNHIDVSPHYTHWLGMKMICEKRSLNSIELRLELRTEPKWMRIWTSLIAITLRS